MTLIKYRSTNGRHEKVSITDAAIAGLAEDGGLFVPDTIPEYDLNSFNLESYQHFTKQFLKPFFVNSFLEDDLDQICDKAFNFNLKTKRLNHSLTILELFHGPTLAFKDFGARFFSECLNRIAGKLNKKITVIVATSGDTGAAAASAIHLKKNLELVLLYPDNGVSKEQELFLNRWNQNIFPFKVNGSFDDCQKMVKEAFKNAKWTNAYHLNTVNSINILRLLAQMTYYAYTSLLHYKKNGRKTMFIIPSGNFGNATSAYWVKKSGFPVGEIFMSVNSNKFLPKFLMTGVEEDLPLIKTMANAMDVAKPSNFARLSYMFNGYKELKENITSLPVNDAQIKDVIYRYSNEYGYLLCPHSATAAYMYEKYLPKDCILVATASPRKFSSLYNERLNIKVPLPTEANELLSKKISSVNVEADLDSVYQKL